MGKRNKFNIFFSSNMTVLNREPQPLFRHDMVQEQIFGSSVRQLAMLLLERPKSMKYGTIHHHHRHQRHRLCRSVIDVIVVVCNCPIVVLRDVLFVRPQY